MKIIVNGAAGHMGRILCLLIGAADDLELAAAVDASGAEDCLTSLDAFSGAADCLIDFSHHSATDAIVHYAVSRNLPAVIATTGQTDAERAAIQAAGARVPIFFSANMSPAVALLADMAAQAVRMFPDADVEIVERHHNRKVDVPSGTALLLAKSIQDAREGSEVVVGRHEPGRRKPREIGIHSLRLGNEAGIHEVILSTGTQTITLRHEAEDRALFAEGALAAARFIVRQRPGVYSMKDMIG